jgi:hypothetical protein
MQVGSLLYHVINRQILKITRYDNRKIIPGLNYGVWVSEGIAPPFSTPALDDWSASRPGRLTPRTHCMGGWVGPSRSGRYVLPLQGIEPRLLGHPPCSLVAISPGLPHGTKRT